MENKDILLKKEFLLFSLLNPLDLIKILLNNQNLSDHNLLSIVKINLKWMMRYYL